jgi:hypothetical protein
MDAAHDVAHVTTDETAAVASEAKAQLQDLYAQTRQELSDQASKQQVRVASGLRDVGDELASMARSSERGGVASDLVQRASDRVGGAAAWLYERDPKGVLDEVKDFARRRPGVFIAGAAIAGVLVGRLTRALAQSAAESSGSGSSSGPVAGTAASVRPADFAGAAAGSAADSSVSPSESTLPAPGPGEDVPVYAESAANFDAGLREDSDERPDAF